MMETQEEIVVNSATGGAKGSKPIQLAWAPAYAMEQLGLVYGYGATKYEPNNFRRGYLVSLSLNALWRHLLRFQGGETVDPESGLPHMAHAAWHCINIIQTLHDHPEMDDRWEIEGVAGNVTSREVQAPNRPCICEEVPCDGAPGVHTHLNGYEQGVVEDDLRGSINQNPFVVPERLILDAAFIASQKRHGTDAKYPSNRHKAQTVPDIKGRDV